ncbi:beta-phosphoglucomutase [Rhodoferax koreense]|uniref:Beta-phosphoglucomutase n=1 Tax=Rhodoferax koreensis TaxID=1842727 RepID=A0A1P8JTH1_9BURK|nr:beta-phosphoglucomutase [Rhodoferax koreense]APW37040.1 beta-phosphoglucomutase [Rhodoferax koreense]
MATEFRHAFIFDLDGVITDTAALHLAAWHELALALGLPFNNAMGERLKGVSRMESLELILGARAGQYSNEQKMRLADRKNAAYVRLLARITSADLLPGAVEALKAVRASGLGLALASASKNALAVLDRLQITGLFDHVVDANQVRHGKPDPEIFLRAAQALGVAPGRCVGVEDAVAGVQAIRSAGMFAVGVGSRSVLFEADRVIPDLTHFHPTDYLR